VTTNATAKVYAAVLKDIGIAKGKLDLFAEELAAFNEIVRGEENLSVFLSMPDIDKERKKNFIQKTCGGKMSEEFVYFLCVLIDNDRQGELASIESILSSMIDEEKNAVRVNVVSSAEIDSVLREKIIGTLGRKYGKEIVLHEEINPSILGGIIIKVGDTVIDGSLAKRLVAINERLHQCSIEGDAVYEN
jgi:F-type H+-transporting ATPase subunit delta